MHAVILAGGKGTRLAARLNGRPKPLIDVDGVPLLERQILTLKAAGVTGATVLVNHAADQIARYCAERENFGIALDLIDDGEPRGTAGAVLATLDRLPERFLIIYGDTLFNIDFERLITAHVDSGAGATLFLHPNDHPQDSDLVELEDGAILAFHPKPHPDDAYLQNMVNAALYVVERSALKPFQAFPVPADFGQDLFPAMLAAGTRLNAYVSFEYIKDLGTPGRLDKATSALRRGVVERACLATKQACVLVDRDGTLNELRDYVRTPDDLKIFPGVAEAMRALNDHEVRVALVTNQPVIARGECKSEGLRRIHGKLDQALAETGAFIDRVYFCPHHPHKGYAGEIAELKIECSCRKPKPGMLQAAMRDLNADPKRTWMIGDSTSDVAAARATGVPVILLETGEGGRDNKYSISPEVHLATFADAVAYVLAALQADLQS